ncbi:hypothetical protein [Neorhizobium sp. DT-125]|uniref:hypothetical protein n=1 Tax=Neorhizobium sp. DT-125 TaxID=3396163 RepID=UPI003F1B1CDD
MSFPICRGIGFSASRPGYEPYYCDTGFRLTHRRGDSGNEVACVSSEARTVGDSLCRRDYDGGSPIGRWRFEAGRRVCKADIAKRPNIRQRPRFVEVTIDGLGRRRVWF